MLSIIAYQVSIIAYLAQCELPRANSVGNLCHPKAVNPAPTKTVVIVDDDRDYTQMLTQLLGLHLDCTVVTFSRPRVALAALPRLNAGVIVTDYEMPELNGFEFMAEAAPLVPGVPFILITGHPVAALAPQIRASAVKAVLSKPFSSEKLFHEIERFWPETAGTLPRVNSASAYLQSGIVA